NLQRLNRAGRNIFQCDRPAAKQVSRTGKDLKRSDPAIGKSARKTGVLRPDAMLCPDFRSDRSGGLVTIAMRRNAGRGIVPQMAMHIYDARRHIFASAVNDDAFRRYGGFWSTDRDNLAVRHEDRAIVDPLSLAIEYGHAGNRDIIGRIGFIG